MCWCISFHITQHKSDTTMQVRFTLFFLLTAFYLQGQNTFLQKMHVGINAGASQYTGSLQQSDIKAGAGLQIAYEITDKIHVRLNGYLSELSASQANLPNFGPDSRSEDYYFRSNLNEISLLAQYDFFNLNAGKRITPYVFGAAAIYDYKPYQEVGYYNAKGDLRYANLAMEQTHPFKNQQIAFPVGLGVKYAFNPNLRMFAEGNYRIMNNLLLDNYADDNNFDSYYSVNVGLLFRLYKSAGGRKGISGKDCDCPVY